MGTRHYLWLAIGALGFATGLAIPKMKGTPPGQAPQADTAPAKSPRGGAGDKDKAAGSVTLPPMGKLPASTDTIESLLELKGTEQYTRTGLWLLDATEEDMAALWKAYRERSEGKPGMWMKDLIFTQWAKKNPRVLLEVAKRDGEEGPAWWAWAMSDPDAALAEVQNHGEAMRDFVLRGIGNFHPKRALKMLEEDPSLASHFKMKDLALELGRHDPRVGIEFLQKHSRGNSFDMSDLLKRWVAKDPHEAFEWLSKDGKPDPSLSKTFYSIVESEKPEVLAELAAGLPSGSFRRDLETRSFERLAQSDPEKALEEARNQESPLLSAQRLAQVGKQLVDENPERALETLGELLEKCPDAPYRMNWTRYPNGASGGGGGVAQVNELLQSLAAWNPQQTMERVIQSEKDQDLNPMNRGSDDLGSIRVAKVWLAQDADAYAAWLGGQDEGIRTNGAGNAANYFAGRQDYDQAVSWALKIPDPQRQVDFIGNTLSNWHRSDRAAASAWLAEAPLSAEQRQRLQQRYPSLNKIQEEEDFDP